MEGQVIKADSIIKIGQRVEFYMDEGKFKSRVEDITDKELVVAMPQDEKGRPIIPMTGSNLYGAVLGDQCRYRFFADYHGKGIAGVPVWYIQKPETVERLQNRSFVRVKCDLPVLVQAMDKRGGFMPQRETRMLDISGNGVCFMFDESLREESQVIMEVHNLPDIGTLIVMGRVMRCSEVKKGEVYHIGVQLMNISRAVRNKLVKYVFDIQRADLAKGLDTGGVRK